jgi:hypothetical protein
MMEMEKYGFQIVEVEDKPQSCGGVYRHFLQPLFVVCAKDGFQKKEMEEFFALEQEAEGGKCRYMLCIAEGAEEIELLFLSGSKEIRALEFLDYLIPDFGFVKGDGEKAKGQISSVILKVKMAQDDLSEVTEFFLKQVNSYFTDCDEVETEKYGTDHREEICKLPKYVKRKEGWAFVKSLEVAEKGQQLKIKTLENESGMTLTAGEDAYIMIGCKGEVYDMKRQKFEATYEATDKPLDVFEQMLDFIPAVENADTGEYISLDELAHICYPKQGSGIYAKKLTKRTKVFPGEERREYYYGHPGDYMVTRADDFCDSYIIQGDVFEQTYELV